MSEQNEQPISPPQLKEVCSMRIVFPIVSDEQALDIRKGVKVLLQDIPDAQVHFSIIPSPALPALPMR